MTYLNSTPGLLSMSSACLGSIILDTSVDLPDLGVPSMITVLFPGE